MGKVTETENLLAREWDVIVSAPLSFFAAVLVVAGIIWLIIWLIHKGQIDALKSRNDTKDERLKLAEDKLAREAAKLAQIPTPSESSDQATITVSTIAEAVRAELSVVRNDIRNIRGGLVSQGSQIKGEGRVFGPVPFEGMGDSSTDSDKQS